MQESKDQKLCGSCKHFLPNQNTDGIGNPLGICLNVNSVFKTNFRTEENYCQQWEQKLNQKTNNNNEGN